jgi:protein NirF
VAANLVNYLEARLNFSLREWLAGLRPMQAMAGVVACSLLLAACTTVAPPLRGTGDLGIVIERATGSVQIVDTTHQALLGRVTGLGDLSHASAVFSRDGRYAYVFGRDGGLSKIDLLRGMIERRVMQAGNSIGGAISQDGKLIAAQNYVPGGVKVFSADTLALISDIPATYGTAGLRSKVVGLADAPGNRFVWSLFDAGEIWVGDFSEPSKPRIEKYKNIGREPYDGLITPNGRYYLAGLFGEDGMAMLDLWFPEQGVRRILDGYGRGQEKLPVYKMPHLRGWAVAGRKAYLPAVGHHEVLVVDTETWNEVARIKVSSQPVFVVARPDGRQVWVIYAFPDNGKVDVIDVETRSIIKQLSPGRTVLHMEFTPRGEAVWISSRDDNRVVVYDTETFARRKVLPAESPSGIFFTHRAARTGF